MAMKPIAEHNAEMSAHMEKWFAADCGRKPRVFVFIEGSGYVALAAVQDTPQAGFLNYDGKFEMLADPTLGNVMVIRHDMTDAQFAALETVDAVKCWRRMLAAAQ